MKLPNSEIKTLEKSILYHRELYYNKQPEITDAEFDGLIDKLRELKPNSSVLQAIGATPKRHKIQLPFILGSLDKVGPSTAIQWMKKQDGLIFLSHKLDGVSVYAEWKQGKLTMLSTRGDGYIGEDILYKAHKFKDLPLNLEMEIDIAARGEAYISGDIPEGYKKTKRHAAAGIINRDDLTHADKIKITFYELIKHPKPQMTESGRYRIMEVLGLKTPTHFMITQKELNTKGQAIIDWMISILRARTTLPYDIDGLVLVSNNSRRENVKIPKQKIAFKVDQLPVETQVTEIEWNVTRTGRIVPVVHIDTTEIDGVEIDHPTGHNYNWLITKGIGPGAKVTVVRAGDVIPQIISVITQAKIVRPKKCPTCASILGILGVDLVCKNPNCKGQAIAKLEYFLKIMGVENISAPTLERLRITTVDEFFKLNKKKIASIEGLGDLSADMILEERNKILRTTKEKLLTAFGIPLIGDKIAKKIVDAYFSKDFEEMFKSKQDDLNKLYNNLMNIDGIGNNIAYSFVTEINNYKALYEFLLNEGLEFVKVKTTNKLKGKSFQFTGTMSMERSILEMLVLNNGGRLASVTKKLDFLVLADKDGASTKATKARQLGIKMITEVRFLKMIE